MSSDGEGDWDSLKTTSARQWGRGGGAGSDNNFGRSGYNNRGGGNSFGQNRSNYRGSNQYRNRSRSPNERFNGGRDHSKSPHRKFGKYDRNANISPQKQDVNEAANLSEPLVNPIVASAFQKLITNATLGMGTSDNEMMTFKQFIFQSDENFDEETALERYNAYKKKFKCDHLNKFFNEHKSFEWFNKLYDPVMHEEDLKECQADAKKRHDVFMYLYNDLNIIKGQLAEISNQAKLNEVLDSAAIMIEGGSIEQLAELNQFERSSKLNNSQNPQIDSENTKPTEKGSIWNQFVKEPSKIDTDETNGDAKSANGHDMELDANDKKAESIKDSFHKTSSIFINNLPESISLSELKDFASNYEGFKRVFIQTPLSIKRWHSRAWIVFHQDVDITKICADFCKHVFNNGSSIAGVVSRTIQFRIRPVSGISNHKDVMIKDLKSAIKLVLLYDAKWGLYGPTAPEICEKPNLNNLKIESGNPLLKNIAGLIVEEADYDEEIINEADQSKKQANENENPYKSNMPLIQFATDNKLKEAIDQIILYLRIVHSIDFYSVSKLNYESKGPHVIGLFHSRADFVREHVNKRGFDEYQENFANRLTYIMRNDPFLEQKDIDFAQFRDLDTAVSEFISANSKEITSEKWKCLVCEKKFRDSPFLAKHINNKHSDLLDQVRRESIIFNNYLSDSQRPGIFIQGVGKLTDNKDSQNSKKPSIEQTNSIYNNAVSSLSSNPILMATFINQAIASSNVGKLPSTSIGSGHRFNQIQERRSITSYTDVDYQG